MLDHKGNLIDLNVIFKNLSLEQISSVNKYFLSNLNANKYSRKSSELSYSFIKTSRGGLFAISDQKIGFGANGKVKIAKSIKDNRLVAVKIQFVIIYGVNGYQDLVKEGIILQKLDQLYGSAIRWYKNTDQYLANSTLEPTNSSWFSIFDLKDRHKNIDRKLKYYLFFELFDGVTIYQYLKKTKFSNYITATETFLKIVIKILQQLEYLHNYTIVHGDLNFNNVLLTKDINNNFVINLIDFGMAVTLKNNLAKCKSFYCKYDVKNNYIPPEYDVKIVAKEIIPKLRSRGRIISTAQEDFIIDLASKNHGFITKNSDLYVIAWNMSRILNLPKETPLMMALKSCMQLNPFYRGSIKFLINQCLQQIDLLDKINITQKLSKTRSPIDPSFELISNIFANQTFLKVKKNQTEPDTDQKLIQHLNNTNKPKFISG